MSNQENQQSLASPTPSPWRILPPVFPPLPPLPPPDVTKLPNSPSPMSLGIQNESRPRRFGVRITNILNTGTGPHDAESTSPFSVAMTSAQRLHHQCQYFPQLKDNKACAIEVTKSHKREEVLVENASNKDSHKQLGKSVLPPQPTIPSLQTTPVQPGRTIWSVTPEELAELAKGMAVVRKEPARKLSYAEASKRNLPENFAVKKNEAVEVEVEQVPRTFKKYFGLPIIPYSEPSYSDVEMMKEKGTPSGTVVDADTEDKLADTLKYSKIFGLSANTPTFYPRQNTDTNELMQMLKSSLASKKVAPHMDWWPGDWKCTNCGNHNFSYRDTCKRCRVGRLEDAGFVFPPSHQTATSTFGGLIHESIEEH